MNFLKIKNFDFLNILVDPRIWKKWKNQTKPAQYIKTTESFYNSYFAHGSLGSDLAWNPCSPSSWFCAGPYGGQGAPIFPFLFYTCCFLFYKIVPKNNVCGFRKCFRSKKLFSNFKKCSLFFTTNFELKMITNKKC